MAHPRISVIQVIRAPVPSGTFSKFRKNPEETMHDLNPKNLDPRLIARAADFLGTRDLGGAAAAASMTQPDVIPGRGPIMMPMAMPGPGGGGGYNRYREMTLEE